MRREQGICQAVFRECFPFITPELSLPVAIHQLNYRNFLNIAKQVVLVDKMIARVDIAVMLDHHCRPAGGRKDADPVRLTVPVGKGGIKVLDIDRSDIMPHPFVKDPYQELPVLFRTN